MYYYCLTDHDLVKWRRWWRRGEGGRWQLQWPASSEHQLVFSVVKVSVCVCIFANDAINQQQECSAPSNSISRDRLPFCQTCWLAGCLSCCLLTSWCCRVSLKWPLVCFPRTAATCTTITTTTSTVDVSVKCRVLMSPLARWLATAAFAGHDTSDRRNPSLAPPVHISQFGHSLLTDSRSSFVVASLATE